MPAKETVSPNTSRLRLTYSIVAVEEMTPPDGEKEGACWHRYVIEGGGSPITGCRKGSREQVMEYAEEFVEELNTRAKGRGASVWAPRLKK